MIEVSEKAQMKMNEYLEQNSLSSPVRIYMAEGGCCGASLSMALDESRESDGHIEAGGQTWVIDKDLLDKVGGVKVDYVEMGARTGFTVSSEKPVGQAPAGGCGGGGGGCSC